MSDVHNVLCSTALLSSHRLMPIACYMESVHLIVVFLCSCYLLFSQHYYLFLITPTSHEVPKVGQLQSCHFSSNNVSGIICSRTHLFIFLLVQGICRALLQYHISNESSFSLPAFFTVQLLHPCIVTRHVRVWMIIAFVPNDTSLLLVFLHNSSISVPPSLSFLLIS